VGIFGGFCAVLNEGKLSQQVQYMIVLMQVWVDKYKVKPILREGLDLVEEDEQITHHIQLDQELDVQNGLSKFENLFFFLFVGRQRFDFFYDRFSKFILNT
jgi:pre-mRNA-splicing factor CWC22